MLKNINIYKELLVFLFVCCQIFVGLLEEFVIVKNSLLFVGFCCWFISYQARILICYLPITFKIMSIKGKDIYHTMNTKLINYLANSNVNGRILRTEM